MRPFLFVSLMVPCPDDDLRGTQVVWTMVGGKLVFGSPKTNGTETATSPQV